jgi:CheY-like chemotaxis protein
LKSFREDLYDLLILDITMPQIDGFGLCEPMTSIENDVKVGFITTFEVNFQALRVVFPTAIATDDLGCFIRKPEVQQFIKVLPAQQSCVRKITALVRCKHGRIQGVMGPLP